MTDHTALRGALAAGMAASITVFSLSPTLAAPAKKTKPAVGVRGTTQMAGADGVFGQTYTLKSGFNYTVTSAEYSVTRVNAYDNTVPTADQKLVVLHVRLKNSSKEDNFFDQSAHGWTAVDSDGQNYTGGSDYGRASTGKVIVTSLKPGQGYDDVVASILVPAKGPIVKLILNNGRMGTSDDVMRFNIGPGKNVIAPLPDYVRDPADATGATALTDVPAKPGVYYPMGTFDVRFDNFQYVDGPVHGNNPDDGKRFVIATATFKYMGAADDAAVYPSYFSTKITDGDDDDYQFDGGMKATKDDDVPDNKRLRLGEEYTMRYYGQVPADASIKKLTVSEGDSRRYVFDVSGFH